MYTWMVFIPLVQIINILFGYMLIKTCANNVNKMWWFVTCCCLISYAVIAYGCAECPKLSCGREGCDTEFCYHCRQLWHPDQTCDQARRQRARHTLGTNDASALYVFTEEPSGGTAHSVGITQWKACLQTGQISSSCHCLRIKFPWTIYYNIWKYTQ